MIRKSERNHLEDMRRRENNIKMDLKGYSLWTRLIWLGQGPVVGCFEYEICALLGYYAALTLEVGTDTLSVNNYHTTPHNIPE